MEADKRRRIKDGKEFDHLFPPPSGIDKSIKKDANVEDTLSLIKKTVPETLWHTKAIAKKLKGRTLDETCSNIWHFVYEHIQYKRDKDGVEQIRSPRRTWWERNVGVDCDCYTEFILSILLNLNIPCKARITKYPKELPEVPRWQHIYPIVPRSGDLSDDLVDRNDYIVIDCVKDEYNSEQPFLDSKDYDMRLDYLDGFEDEREVAHDSYLEYEDHNDFQFDTIDAEDIAALYGDDLGFLKKLVKKVGSTVKKVGDKVGSAVKTVASNIKKTAPILVKKVGDEIGKGVRFINRYVNPATILLRNGFLLAMKINMMNVGGKIRYAYLTDEQARAQGINLDVLRKLRTVKDRAETVYWQAGGKKENLKKAILGGKANKDRKVPMSGLGSLDDNVYADLDEYRIIHSDPDTLEGLGEIASGTAIAAATGAVSAIAAALKQIKGLFTNGGAEEASFQSETDNAGTAASAPAMISEDEDQIIMDIQDMFPPGQYQQPSPNQQPQTYVPPVTQYNSESLPGSVSTERRIPATTQTENTSVQKTNTEDTDQGFFEKTTTWVKENPAKTLLIAGGIAASGYLVSRSFRAKGNALNGITSTNSKGWKRRKKSKHKKKRTRKQHKIQSITL